METENNTNQEDFWKEAEKRHKRGKLIGGIFIVIAGSLFLARELGAVLPDWIFTWKTLLISVGVMLAFKHGFRRPVWLIPIAIGTAYLVSDAYPLLAIRHLLWPILIIIFGLIIIFKPHRKHHRFHRRRYQRYYRRHHHYQHSYYEQTLNDDRIETNTFMGAVKKTILSKSFKGGELNNVLGGTELNLSQADFEGTITLEINNVLGGTTLIVPANWEISSELVSVLGSIDDKRAVQNNPAGQNSKKLILKGTVFMGGIEIKSFTSY